VRQVVFMALVLELVLQRLVGLVLRRLRLQLLSAGLVLVLVLVLVAEAELVFYQAILRVWLQHYLIHS
jgi:hypothetical protein